MSTTTRLVTAEQLFEMPDSHYELVKGELRKMSPSGFRHGAVIMNLGGPLHQFVKTNHLGVVCGSETGFVLERNPDTVLAPDIAFVRKNRIPLEGLPQTFWDGAPDLVVEVLSPSDTVREVEEKVDAWLSLGALAVWAANPKRKSVTVHRRNTAPRVLTEGDILEGEDLVPGFRINVADIFSD